MLTLIFLVNTVFDFYVMILLLRIWMQWVRCDFYNPLSQLVIKLTQPVIKPLRRVLPSLGPIDTSSLLLALLLTTLKVPLLFLITEGRFPVAPVYLVVGLIELLKAAGHLLFWVIIIRSIMSWVSQGQSPIENVLTQLTEPLMAPVRRLLPPVGGLDFSAMAVIFILYLLNYLGKDFFQGLW